MYGYVLITNTVFKDLLLALYKYWDEWKNKRNTFSALSDLKSTSRISGVSTMIHYGDILSIHIQSHIIVISFHPRPAILKSLPKYTRYMIYDWLFKKVLPPWFHNRHMHVPVHQFFAILTCDFWTAHCKKKLVMICSLDDTKKIL